MKRGKGQELIAELGALSEENDRLAAFAQDGAAIATFVQDATKARSRRLTDDEIVTMMLGIEPDLTHIQISDEFSENPIVLLTKEGLSFEGVIIGLREGAVQLRQADGKVVHVLKNVITALRRP